MQTKTSFASILFRLLDKSNNFRCQKENIMCKFKNFKNALSVFFVVMLGIAATNAYSEKLEGGRRLTTPIGDIAFEVVGQVSNLSPSVSKQYGYLTFVNGLNADQIFDSANQWLGWDGTYKGKLQPTDVYGYTLDAEFSDGQKLRKTGDITLLR